MTNQGNDRAQRLRKKKARAAEASRATGFIDNKPAAVIRRLEICDKARIHARDQNRTTSIQDRTPSLPKFTVDEITLGKKLGKGGFGTVFEIRAFNVTEASKGPKPRRFKLLMDKFSRNREGEEEDQNTVTTASENSHATESRQFIANHCVRPKSGDARYAVKFINPEIIANDKDLHQAVIDTSNEARFLSAMEHPNIVKLRAISVGDDMFHENAFLVMDRLYDTLEARLLTWDTQMRRYEGLRGKVLDRKAIKRAALWEERMVAAYDLASALHYMHSRRLIHRDLKPENVGFDIRNDIKIFDFGLARELPSMMDEDHECEDASGLFKLTGFCGSPRYMAPEVALREKYNETADVYSFALLFWEMLALTVPYSGANMGFLRLSVWSEKHVRPELKEQWNQSIRDILAKAWAPDCTMRPDMGEVAAVIRQECVALRDGYEAGLEHEGRRSTHVFQGRTAELENLRAEFKSSSQLHVSSRRPSRILERRRSSRREDLAMTGCSFRKTGSCAA